VGDVVEFNKPLTALRLVEWERDEALGLHDDGDAA
jgi:hypothetical protein